MRSSSKRQKLWRTNFCYLKDLAERGFFLLIADMRSTVLHSDGQKLGTE